MLLSHQVQNDVDVVTLSGRLILKDAAEVRERLRAIIENGQNRLLLDLGGLTFIDSSGCSVLISAFKAMRARDGRLALCNLTPEVQSLIELTRLTEIFEIFPDASRALAELQGS